MEAIKKIIQNIKYILKEGFQLALTFLTIVGTYFTLFNPDKNEIGIKERGIILVLCIAVAYAIYFVYIIRTRMVTVYEKDNKKITVQYGDLIGLMKEYEGRKKKAIFVIPVNRCFDMVTDNVLVEEGTVHGQFVKYYTETFRPLIELEEIIKTALSNRKGESVPSNEKDKGNTTRYPVGTIVKIETQTGNIFYLLALTKFKKHNEKIVVDDSITIHDYLECLQCMVDYYNIDGRNLPIYLPTIGCGLSRLALSIDESVRQLIDIWCLNKKVIRGNVNIVVYKKNFWNVHILKYKREGN